MLPGRRGRGARGRGWNEGLGRAGSGEGPSGSLVLEWVQNEYCRTIVIKVTKYLESTTLVRGKGFSESTPFGAPVRISGATPGEPCFLKLSFIDCKMGRMSVLARPDLPSQDRLRGFTQKVESRILYEP